MRQKLVDTMTSGIALASAIALAPSIASAQNTATSAAPAGEQAPGAAAAASEIVVTAQRRSEKSVDVPITVTTLNSSQLATASVTQLSDTAKITPGLRFDTEGPAVQPTIRGVGTAITTSGGGPNVGIYVDGFFQPNTYMSNFDLMQVKDIQVLKGPQGTLFGRNTTGGAILVTTADPSTKTSGELRASYGSYNASTVQGYFTTGLAPNVAFDIQALYRSGDGYFTNLANGDHDAGKYHNLSIRTGLKVDLTDKVSVLLRYAHAETDDPTTQLVNAYVDDGGRAGFFSQVSAAGQAAYGKTSSAGLALVNLNVPSAAYATTPGQVNLPSPVSFKTRSDSAQVTIKADLGFADLTSYTQYRHDRSPYYGDLDATAAPLFDILVDVWDETYSQEFLLNSKAGSRLQWTVGANYFQNVDNWSDIKAEGAIPNFGGPSVFIPFGGSSTTTKSYAAFADLTYAVVPDKLYLTLGGRYSHDVVADAYFITNEFTPFTGYTGPNGQNIPFTGAPGTVIPVANLDHDSFTPRIVLRYKPTDRSSAYASYTRGYKAGILNVGGDSEKPVAPETNDAFEVGYKFADRRLSVELASFLYEYKNLQVSSFQAGAAEITNAASAEIYGVEGQFHYRFDDHLDLNAGGVWTHARYKSFAKAPFYSYCDPTVSFTSPLFCASGSGSLVETTTNASGDHMQRSPDFTANAGASYGLDVAGGRMTLSGNLYYTSSFYFDPEQQFYQKAYSILSLRAQWVDPSNRYTLAVFGDNVADTRYRTQVLFNTIGVGSVWNSPATFGGSVGVKF